MWYFGVRDAGVRFDSCIATNVRLCCAHEMLKFFHGAPYAVCVELNYFFLFGGLLLVSCVGVCGAGVGAVGVATDGSLCDGDMWGESERV